MFLFFLKKIFPLLVFSFLVAGCAGNSPNGVSNSSETSVTTKIFRGKVIDKPGSDRIIRLETNENGRLRVVTIHFNRKTRGIDYLARNKHIIITCRKHQNDLHAVAISPELEGYAEGVTEISPLKVKRLQVNRKKFILVDSRPFYNYQRSHIPFAISIPACSMAKTLRLPEDKETLLVFYCGGPLCGLSTMASSQAAAAGYTNIRVMEDGMEGWADKGYQTVAEDSFILHGNTIILDLRLPEKSARKRIPGAVSLPWPFTAATMKSVPHRAPVVVYSDSIQQTKDALALLRKENFLNPAMVKGNFQGWLKRGQPTISKPVVTTFQWSQKAEDGEVSPADFSLAVAGKTTAILLDVRTPNEIDSGIIRGAVKIPLHELYEHLDELPMNKKIFVYSSHGARAGMAATILRSKGFSAFFLSRDVQCRNGGCSLVF